ncbi:MAG: hypothetical protein ACRD3J_12835 [Thermoanaerobaculia bacterium]
MTVRRALTILCLAAIVLMRVDRRLLTLPFVDRAPMAKTMASYPEGRWPQFPRFMAEVRARTKAGDSIALVVPAREWDGGYSDAYYRASYLLAGREVLPVVNEQDEPVPQNLRSARYIAAIGVRFRLPAEVIWQGEGGALLRLRH